MRAFQPPEILPVPMLLQTVAMPAFTRRDDAFRLSDAARERYLEI